MWPSSWQWAGDIMNIDIYADILCPWCYIGKRRLSAALALLDRRDEVCVTWRSFELSPDQSRTPGPSAAEEILEWRGKQEGAARIERIRTLGAAEGLELNLHLARPVNTFDAHRLVHLAAANGLADAMMERLLHAYHTEGLSVADLAVLIRLGTQVGLAGDKVRATLEADEFTVETRRDEQGASALGVTGVPTLIIDGGQPLPGIQSLEDLARLFAARLADGRGAEHD